MKNILATALTLLIFAAQAQIPQTISFQGFLTDSNGDPVAGTVTLDFRIYRTSDDFNEWSEQHVDVPVANGLYNVQLGSVTPFSFAFDQGYELEIDVDTETLSPRVILNSSAFALGASNVFGDTNTFPSDGSVGVGTLTPRDPLEVSGGIRGSFVTVQDDSGSTSEGGELLLAYAGDGTDNPDGFRIDAFNDGTDRLRIFNGTGVLLDIDDAGTSQFLGGVTATSFTGDGSGLSNLPTSPWTGSPAISYSSGFVGIGTASPTNEFHIQGTATSAGVFGKVENTDLSGFAAWLLRNDNRSYSLAVGGSTASTAPNKFYIFNGTSGEAALVADGIDNIGIGTESPDFRLHVEDDATASNNPLLKLQRLTGGSAAPIRFQNLTDFYTIGITGSDEFAISSSGGTIGATTDYLRIQNDGDVGIGTTTPGARLDVSLGTGSGDIATFSGVANNSRLKFNIGGNDSFIDGDNGNNLHLGTSFSGTSLSIRNSDGNVGVGTTTPAYGFQVEDDFASNITPVMGVERNGTSSAAPIRFTNGASNYYNIGITQTDEFSISAVNNNMALSTDVFLIQGDGDIGIGTTSPSYQLDIESTSTTYVLGIDKNNATGSSMVIFERQGAFAGSISESGGTVSYNAFTGSHFASSSSELERGQLVSLTGEYELLSESETGEPLYSVIPTSQENDPKVLGTFLHKLDDEKISSLSGIPSAIMAVGNGEMWVVDNGENVNVGDYLISSGTPGHGMKDKGDFEIAYVVGRAAEAVNWSEVNEESGGKKHKRINVFFENFIKNHKAEKLEKRLEELEDRFKAFENSVDSKLKQLEKNSNSQNL